MGGIIDLFYYKSPSLVGVVVKALEGREERQGLDLRRCVTKDTCSNRFRYIDVFKVIM